MIAQEQSLLTHAIDSAVCRLICFITCDKQFIFKIKIPALAYYDDRIKMTFISVLILAEEPPFLVLKMKVCTSFSNAQKLTKLIDFFHWKDVLLHCNIYDEINVHVT